MKSEQQIIEYIATLHESKVVELNNMRNKIMHEDWHGGADSNMDMRDFDAKIDALKWVLE